MAKKILGIEIGNCNIKMAVCSKGSLDRIVVEPIPDGLVERDEIISKNAMAEFIKRPLPSIRSIASRSQSFSPSGWSTQSECSCTP